MEWLLAFNWPVLGAASWSPWWQGHVGPEAQPEPGVDRGETTVLEVVAVLYAALAGEIGCARCRAVLDPDVRTDQRRSWFARARIVATTSCLGPDRHRHEACVVVERGGDLRFGRWDHRR